MRFGECGHPLRGGECEEGTPIECDYCTVCFLLEMDSQTVRWDDEEHNDSDLDGESISCILHAEAWNEYHGGREDEANAYHTLMPEGLYLVTNRVDQLVVEGRLSTMRERIKVEEDAFTDNALAQVRIYLGDAWRDANRDGPAMEYGAAADARVGHTSRAIPAWNEEQPMTESRTMWMMRRAGADVGASMARMLMTPGQAEAWDDNDGRVLFDTVNTRGAVAARWVNEPGATPRQPDDEE